MWNPPTEADLIKLPARCENKDKPLREQVIQMHFFLGGCDWFVTEFDAEEGLFFCFAILNNDLLNAEWGYSSLQEMSDIDINGLQVDRDLHWKQRPADQVELIRRAQRWEPAESVH